MTSPFEAETLRLQDESNRLMADSVRVARYGMWIQIFGFIAVIATVVVSIVSVGASTAAVRASNDQLQVAKFQSVYERQLELWHLAAQEEHLAPYIVGGELPPDPSSRSVEDIESIRAAMIAALDLYNYIFVVMAPATPDNQQYVRLAFDASAPPPDNITQDQWESWVTWSWTIRNGFGDSPGLCHQLLSQTGEAYAGTFTDAVRIPEVCGQA